MNRIFAMLAPVGRILGGLALATIVAMNLLMGYIMFAPDDLPKPFYLSSGVATAASEAGGAEVALTETVVPEATPTPVPPGQGVMVETGTKIVNLADPGGRRYLKATIVIEVAPPAEVLAEAAQPTTAAAEGEGAAAPSALTAFNDEVAKRMPMINDVLTTLLSSKTFDSIYTVEGKEKLRQEIMTELTKRLPDLPVIAVYFTEFVVQ